MTATMLRYETRYFRAGVEFVPAANEILSWAIYGKPSEVERKTVPIKGNVVEITSKKVFACLYDSDADAILIER